MILAPRGLHRISGQGWYNPPFAIRRTGHLSNIDRAAS